MMNQVLFCYFILVAQSSCMKHFTIEFIDCQNILATLEIENSEVFHDEDLSNEYSKEKSNLVVDIVLVPFIDTVISFKNKGCERLYSVILSDKSSFKLKLKSKGGKPLLFDTVNTKHGGFLYVLRFNSGEWILAQHEKPMQLE